MQRINIKLLSDDRTINQYFTCEIYKFKETKDGVLFCVELSNMEKFCQTLSDYIWNNHIKKFLQNYARKNVMLTPGEALETGNRALSVAVGIKDGCDVIKEKLQDFLKTKPGSISLEGFVRFRLKDLKKDLQALTDLCAEELIAKREYEDFIALLKSFVEIQKPSKDPVYLKVGADRNHYLLDLEGNDILLKEEKTENISRDDLILSALVSYAPCKIYLYNEKNSNNPQLLETIKSIFTGRVFSVSETFSSPASPGFLQ